MFKRIGFKNNKSVDTLNKDKFEQQEQVSKNQFVNQIKE